MSPDKQIAAFICGKLSGLAGDLFFRQCDVIDQDSRSGRNLDRTVPGDIFRIINFPVIKKKIEWRLCIFQSQRLGVRAAVGAIPVFNVVLHLIRRSGIGIFSQTVCRDAAIFVTLLQGA